MGRFVLYPMTFSLSIRSLTTILEIEETGKHNSTLATTTTTLRKQERKNSVALQEAKSAEATAELMTEAKASYHAPKEEQRQIRTLTDVSSNLKPKCMISKRR